MQDESRLDGKVAVVTGGGRGIGRAAAVILARAGAAVVVAAGTAQRPGESRLDLNRRNAAIFNDIIPRIAEHNRTGIPLIATNPVDILSHVAWGNVSQQLR